MTAWFAKKIGSRTARQWFVVLSGSFVILAGFEAIAFLIGIYQVSLFLQVSILLYLYILFKTSFIFDLKLKKPRSYERSKEYYWYNKQPVVKWLRIYWRTFKLRFQWLFHWQNFKHLQNYFILPAVLYWSVVILIFLNPFRLAVKQLIVVSGTLMMTYVIWFMKVVFRNYLSTSKQILDLMFGITFTASFLLFSGALGVYWYLGIDGFYFPLAIGTLTFLLGYQLFFHRMLVSFSNLRYILLVSILLVGGSFVVWQFWTVNYFTGGLLLAGIAYFFWGVTIEHLERKLTPMSFWGYLLITLLILVFVLVTTNFQARIG